MKRLGFSDKRRLGSGDEYHLTPKIVKDRADRYGVVCEDSEVDSEAQVRGQDILEPYRSASETTTQTPLTTQITPYASLSEKLDYVLGVLRKHPNGVSEYELTRITEFEENELGKILGSLTKC